MVLARIRGLTQRVRVEIQKSFTQDHTPHQIAASFSLGAFITMLPTLGTGLLLFVVFAYLFEWVNKIAMVASVLVFNPVVKWGVYAASFTLGILLLGPVDGVEIGAVPSLNEGPDIVVRLVVGNLILAVIAAVISYVAVYRLVKAYERHELSFAEETVETIVEKFDEQSGEEGSETSVD